LFTYVVEKIFLSSDYYTTSKIRNLNWCWSPVLSNLVSQMALGTWQS